MIPTFSSQCTYKLTACGIGASMQLLQLAADSKYKSQHSPALNQGKIRVYFNKKQESLQDSRSIYMIKAYIYQIAIPQAFFNAVHVLSSSSSIALQSHLERSLQLISMARSSIVGRPQHSIYISLGSIYISLQHTYTYQSNRMEDAADLAVYISVLDKNHSFFFVIWWGNPFKSPQPSKSCCATLGFVWNHSSNCHPKNS